MLATLPLSLLYGFASLVGFCTDQGVPIFVVGRGSNLLVRDGGIRGVVVYPPAFDEVAEH